MDPASGEQHVIRDGDDQAVVVEVGGGLRELVLGGRAAIEAYPESEMCGAGHGQLLLPWPNRIRDGSYTFAGAAQQLALTEPPRHNAIHGLTRWASWRRTAGDASSVVLEHVLHPQPGYPHTLRLEARYALGNRSLTVTLVAENLGETAAPFGAGVHPYLLAGEPGIDPWVLQLPAATRLVLDEQRIPVGREPVAGTAFDFSRPRAIGTTSMDDAFCDLTRGDDGLARVSVSSGDREVILWMDGAFTHVMLFTADGFGRHALGVEPMTCAPDAFNSGEGLQVLEPGDRFEGRWGIAVPPR
jgi:aldose 1-epimerase